MKILFISQDYYPQVSGVPVVVQYLAEGLAQKGHEVNVVTCRRIDNSYKEEINGVTVYRHDIYEDFLKQPKGETRKYIEFVCKFKCDVIIFQCTQCITSDLLFPYLDCVQAKKILHAHGFSGLRAVKNSKLFEFRDGFKHTVGHSYNWIRFWYYYHFWFPRYVMQFDASMVLSEVDSAKTYLDEFLGKKNYVLENAADDMFFVDYSNVTNPLHKFITLKSSRYCFSCANYIVVKNQKQMLEQFYKAGVSDLALVCIGRNDTTYYYECKQLIKELEKQYGPREVHLLYDIDRKYIPLIVSAAKLYLVSSVSEEYSISIIEAMAQGVPFISTNVGNASVLPGGITLDSIENMYQAIQLLASDENKYTILSEQGKKYANTYNRKRNAIDRLEKIIYTTLQG